MSTIQHTGCGYEAAGRDAKLVPKVVNKICRALRKRINDFDGIVISGYSMALIGPIVAFKLKKNVCVVSKENDARNSYQKVEGLHSQRWLMIDDLVSSGRTLSRVADGVKRIEGTLVGVVLYFSTAKGNACGYCGIRVPIWQSFLCE